jgi:hypothetical protein
MRKFYLVYNNFNNNLRRSESTVRDVFPVDLTEEQAVHPFVEGLIIPQLAQEAGFVDVDKSFFVETTLDKVQDIRYELIENTRRFEDIANKIRSNS